MIQSAPAEEGSKHPAWQWVGFGVVMIVTAWLPLASGAMLVTPFDRPFLALACGVVPIAMASFGGGFVVGRWGKPAGAREALVAGLVTGILALVATGLRWRFFHAGMLAVPALTAPFAWLGGRYGVKRRPA